MTKPAKVKFIGITEFNQNISKYIREVASGETFYYLTWRDKPISVLVGQSQFNLLMRLLDESMEKGKK